MSYLINAWLENGESRLGIVDAHSGEVRQLWRLNKISVQPCRRDFSRTKSSGIQQLVKELFLVGCAEDLSLVQQVQSGNIGDICLDCDQCADQPTKRTPVGSNIIYLDLIGD